METIEKLSHTLDFTDHASQIIHALVHVLDQSPDLRPAAMETLCRMMTQLGQRYKIFIPMVKKVWEGRRREGVCVCVCGGRKERGGERRGMRKERGSGKKSRGRERGRAKAGTGEQGESGWREGEKRGRKRKSRREEREKSGSRGRGLGQNFTMTVIFCFQVMNKHRYSHTMYELLLSRLIHVSYMSTNIHFLFTGMKVILNLTIRSEVIWFTLKLKGLLEPTHFLFENYNNSKKIVNC